MYFNYKKAWEEFVKPEFDRLLPRFAELYKMTEYLASEMRQVGATNQLENVRPELIEAFKNCSYKALLTYFGEIVFYYGHLSPCGTAQKDGLYWKFKDLVWMACKDIPDWNLTRAAAMSQVSQGLERFHKKPKSPVIVEPKYSSVEDYYNGLSI